MPERDIEFISDASKWDRWLIEELFLEEGPYPEKEKLTAFSHIRIVETESYGWERLKGEMRDGFLRNWDVSLRGDDRTLKPWERGL
jgi:hypothetical protein